MLIEIHEPEVEAMIRERVTSGGFQTVEDVVIHAVKSLPAAAGPAPIRQHRPGRKSLAQLFAESPFKGLNIDFERDPDYGRDVTL